MLHSVLTRFTSLTSILFFSHLSPAAAQTFLENFATSANFGSGDLVWNFVVGAATPPLTIYDWDYTLAAPAAQNRDIDVGDGSHGAFNNTTYGRFDIDGDNSNGEIVINTDNYPSGLNVTDFELDLGITLRPIGTLPLVIKSLSDIYIAGTIDCSGADGTALNADDSQAPQGGQGRCGGADGGDGGSTTLAPTNGIDVSGSVTGGTAGAAGGASGGIGGGGGGAHSLAGAIGDPGEDPNIGGADDGGNAGLIDNTDPGFSLLQGGAGGGGGSASDNALATDSSGGAGGAGGGVIVLMAAGNIEVTNSGFVFANGGNGGGDAGALIAGAGGGGGGGAIAMYAGGSVINDHILGITADGGGRGTTTNAAGGGSHGGNGSPGRIWMTDSDAALGGGGSEPGYANVMINLGTILPREGAFTAVSGAVDLGTSSAVIEAVNLITQTAVGNTVTIEFASGAEPGFNPAGVWIDSSLFTGEGVARYLKFRITLNNTDRNQLPAETSSISVTYDPFLQTQFEFIGACGLSQSRDRKPPISPLILTLIFMIPVLTMLFLRKTQPG